MVSHFPGAISASAEDLEPLDLMVGHFRDVQCFAIRCYYEQGDARIRSYFLLGPSFPNDFAEPFLQDHVEHEAVLTYGANYRFDISTAPDSVTIPCPDLYSPGSGVVPAQGKSFFRFSMNPNAPDFRLGFIDLSTGAVVAKMPEGPKVLVTKWGISTGLGAEEKPVVVIPTQ